MRRPRPAWRRPASRRRPRRSRGRARGCGCPRSPLVTPGWRTFQARASCDERDPQPLGDRPEPFHEPAPAERLGVEQVDVVLSDRPLRPRCLASRPRGTRCPGVMAPVSSPNAERPVGDDARRPARRTSGSARASSSAQHGELRLQRVHVADRVAPLDQLLGEVRDADPPDRPASPQFAPWRPRCPRPARPSVGPVQLIEVDPVDAQAGQAASQARRTCSGRKPEPSGCGATFVAIDDLVAASGDRPAHERLRDPLAVHLGRVDPVRCRRRCAARMAAITASSDSLGPQLVPPASHAP